MTTFVVAPEESGLEDEKRKENMAIREMCERLLLPSQIDALMELFRVAEEVGKSDRRRARLLKLRGWFVEGKFEDMMYCVQEEEILYREERDLVLVGCHGFTPYALTLLLSRIPRHTRLPRLIKN